MTMLRNRFSLLYYLRKPNKHHTGKVPIYLRITIDSQRTELSTQMSCEPARWNRHAGRLTGTKEEVRFLNAFLDTLQIKVSEVYRQLVETAKPFNAETIKQQLQGVKEKPRMIIEVFQQHNTQMQALLGKDFAPGTLKRYKTSLDNTRSFK